MCVGAGERLHFGINQTQKRAQTPESDYQGYRLRCVHTAPSSHLLAVAVGHEAVKAVVEQVVVAVIAVGLNSSKLPQNGAL